MDLGLTGKVAIVTGASRGIGLAIARGLAAEGVKLCIAARGEDALKSAASSIEAEGGEVLAQACDMSDEPSVGALVKAAKDRFGRVDIIVSNASPIAIGPTREDWTKCLSVDVLGAVSLVDHALPLMREQGEGVILFISSVSGIEAAPLNDYGYTSAKAALNAYAKKLAMVEAANGIRTNAILPGSVEFPGGGWDEIRQNNPQMYEMVRSGIPFGRLGRPEEIANAAVFLVSPRATWVNGALLNVDGGQSKAIR